MSVYQEITDRIVAELERGATPWVKPWRTDSSADSNVVSKKPYRGINRLLLGMSSMASGYNSPVWGTYKHWQSLDGCVRKGEKGTKIVFFSPVTKETVNAQGDAETGTYALLKAYYVFNSNQIDGIEMPTVINDTNEFAFDAATEERIIKTGALITHGGDSAFYMPSHDRIQMPNKTAFESPAAYYATLLHELTHWTSNKARCDRDLSKGRFGNSEYAFEELVAELGASFLCADYSITGELRHAGYIASWLKCLKSDNKAIFKASALAQKAADYINTVDATAISIAA